MNDDDTKNLNTQGEGVEDAQDASLAFDQDTEGDDVVDVNPVDVSADADVEVEDISDEEENEDASEEDEKEELESEQSEMEMEDSSTDGPSEKDEQAEAEVQEDVNEENAQATDDVTAPAVIDNPNARWYVVHTYSGHENRVATNLRQRIESEHLEHKIVDILVPTQDKIEIRGGKKEQVKEKVFPGYILVKMELDNMAWIAVRTTQGVIGFVGAGTKPMPISDAEVKSIVQFMNQGAAPTFKEVFLADDTVKIIDGPFADFIGKVESVDKEKGKLRVLVSIFGRETPVELDFLQVSKL